MNLYSFNSRCNKIKNAQSRDLDCAFFDDTTYYASWLSIVYCSKDK